MLDLDAKEVETKENAGKTADGRPVIYIYTKGGLHAFFTRRKNTSQIEPIGIGSHRAVAQWMSEKKESIKWKEDFSKKESGHLIKSEGNKKRFNAALNYPKVEENQEKSGVMIVKDWRSKEIILMKEEDLLMAVRYNLIGNDVIVRDLNLCMKAMTATEYLDKKEENGRTEKEKS